MPTSKDTRVPFEGKLEKVSGVAGVAATLSSKRNDGFSKRVSNEQPQQFYLQANWQNHAKPIGELGYMRWVKIYNISTI